MLGRGIHNIFLEIHLWCDTFAGVYSQHSGQSLSAGVARLKWETSDLAVRRANHSATVSSFTGMLSCYRPQSCGMVTFLRLSVILFTGGVSVQGGLCPGRVCPRGLQGFLSRDTPQYGGRVGGTHPTGMHSCYGDFWEKLLICSHVLRLSWITEGKFRYCDQVTFFCLFIDLIFLALIGSGREEQLKNTNSSSFRIHFLAELYVVEPEELFIVKIKLAYLVFHIVFPCFDQRGQHLCFTSWTDCTTLYKDTAIWCNDHWLVRTAKELNLKKSNEKILV